MINLMRIFFVNTKFNPELLLFIVYYAFIIILRLVERKRKIRIVIQVLII